MVNLLNEEIRAIRHTMSCLKKGMSLELDSGKRHRMENDYKELNNLLKDKLEQCGDYKG